jgi:hypothetical protein
MIPSHPTDPVLQRLRRLPRIAPDDVAAARTLAAAEAALHPAPPAVPATATARVMRWAMPLALATWGTLYTWGALGELGRLFPGSGGPRRLAAVAGAPSPVPLVHVQRHEQDQRHDDDDDDHHATFAPRIGTAGLLRRLIGHGFIGHVNLLSRWFGAHTRHTGGARAHDDSRTTGGRYAAGGPRHDRGADGGASGACAGVRDAASVDARRIHTTKLAGAYGGSFPQLGSGGDGSRPTSRDAV